MDLKRLQIKSFEFLKIQVNFQSHFSTKETRTYTEGEALGSGWCKAYSCFSSATGAALLFSTAGVETSADASVEFLLDASVVLLSEELVLADVSSAFAATGSGSSETTEFFLSSALCFAESSLAFSSFELVFAPSNWSSFFSSLLQIIQVMNN